MAKQLASRGMFQCSKPYLFIVCGCSFIGGAYWQQLRKNQKVEYLSLMQRRLSSGAVECPSNLTQVDINSDEHRFKKVRVNGTANPTEAIYISPRKPPHSAQIKHRHDSKNGNAQQVLGAYEYMPIYTASNEIILVNRGWIPSEQIPLQETSKEPTSSSSGSQESYTGLITPLQAVPKFFKDANKFDVNDHVWPFMDNEILQQKYGQRDVVVVDALEPSNEAGEFPHRVQSYDLLYVNVPPIQHSAYVWLFCCAGISCFYYAFHAIRYPRAVHKLRHKMTMPNALNSPRTNSYSKTKTL